MGEGLLAALASLAVVGLMVFGWSRNDRRRLRRDFPCDRPFEGPLEACLVRFPSDEAKTDCVLGANRDGLYLASTPEVLARNRGWMGNRSHLVLAQPLFVPWDRLAIQPASFPLRGFVRFTVSSNKATFFVPRETAVTLLVRAGRPALAR